MFLSVFTSVNEIQLKTFLQHNSEEYRARKLEDQQWEALKSQATRKVGDMMASLFMMGRYGASATGATPDISAALLAERTAASLPFESFALIKESSEIS